MKIKNFIKFHWFLFFLLFSKSLFSADDFESRNTISYGFKLPYSLKLDCEQSLRLSGKELSFTASVWFVVELFKNTPFT